MKDKQNLLIGIIFILFSIIFIISEKYFYGLTLIILLIALPKLDKLTDLVVGFKELKLKFQTPIENVKKDIKENHEKVTRKNFLDFQKIESKILNTQQKKYKGILKTGIHFAHGYPKSNFLYTPDASLQTSEALYFFEIKYIIKPEFTKSIINKTTQHLKTVYDNLLPFMGDKKLIIKLILSSKHDIQIENFNIPKGIEIEFINV